MSKRRVFTVEMIDGSSECGHHDCDCPPALKGNFLWQVLEVQADDSVVSVHTTESESAALSWVLKHGELEAA